MWTLLPAVPDCQTSVTQAAQLAAGMQRNCISQLVGMGGTLMVPVFHISSVSGAGLALMHDFLRTLPAGAPGHNPWDSSNPWNSFHVAD